MRRLIVVTHPEATHHVDGLVGGWFDSGLTARGRQDAARIADAVASCVEGSGRDGGDGTALVASDLTRCRETAAPVAAALGVEATFLPALREKSYGEGEGRPDAWFRERFTPPPAVGERLGHDEGLGAETMGDFARRVHTCMDEVLAAGRPDTVVVTHGGTATMVVAHWLRLPVDALGYARFGVTPGSISVLREDDYLHNRTLVSLNQTEHLGGTWPAS